jgi:Domain of unknown function (DUF927)
MEEIAHPRELYTENRKLHKAFVGVNADIPVDFAAAEPLLKKLQGEEAKISKTVRTADCCGFVEGTNAYLTPFGAYGDNLDVRVSPPPDGFDKTVLGRRNGNIEAFLQVVKPLLRYSSIANYVVALQCTSILAGRIDIGEAGIIHLGGFSGLGKSVVIRAAMSYVGRAGRDDLQTHDATQSGAEDHFSYFRHSMTVLDELATKPGTYEQTLGYCRNLGQTFSSGRGKLKATAYTQRVGQKIRTWCQNGVSSGEKTAQQMAKKIGADIEEGVMRRFVDYPVSKSIFDVEGDNKPNGTNEEQAFFKKLGSGLKNHHGVALPMFVDWIIKTPDLEVKFEAHRAHFNEMIDVDENWQRGLVDKAAANYAGGMLGIEAGIVPRSAAAFETSMLKVCNKMLDYCASSKVDAESLLEKLCEAVKDPKKVPKVKKGLPVTDFNPEKQLGFRRIHDGNLITFLIGARLDAFCGSRRARSKLIELLKVKKLLVAGSGTSSQPVKVPGAAGTHRCFRIKGT